MKIDYQLHTLRVALEPTDVRVVVEGRDDRRPWFLFLRGPKTEPIAVASYRVDEYREALAYAHGYADAYHINTWA